VASYLLGSRSARGFKPVLLTPTALVLVASDFHALFLEAVIADADFSGLDYERDVMFGLSVIRFV